MLRPGLLSLLVIIIAGCHSYQKKATADMPAVGDSAAPLKKADTITLAGNFILFLRPVETDNKEQEVEDDSDFAVGIVNTTDSISQNKKYQGIQSVVSTARYVLIKDCLKGPVLIDRDTIGYGVILSGTGKSISTTYNNVHSGDYLGEVNDYFSLY